MSDNKSTEIIDPSPQPESPAEPKKRGAPFGNRNAYKHGIYVHNSRIWNTTPLEFVELADLKQQILALKQFMLTTYEVIKNTKDPQECNIGLRSLSIAGLSLARMIKSHEDNRAYMVPMAFEKDDGSDPSLSDLEKEYNRIVANSVLPPNLKLD